MTAEEGSSIARHTPPDDQVTAPRAEQWPGLLDKLDVRFLVLDANRDAALLELFEAHPGWVIDFQEHQSVLLVRTDVEFSAAR